MTYSEYWQAVMGPRTPGCVVGEFNLAAAPDRHGLDEWVGHAEEAAMHQCAPEERDSFREACDAHHDKALDELVAAIGGEP